ncbi:hypothetical protein ACFOQM_12520 [Paenibacillus sp. GCM10012307]|uniref:Uncharacterized protein n=1 Tax=Paenibacillus roseus TaxID=2798579 RepID=A0A934IZJ5_9BACL|nr:hypothetical protein [Paenibacillus roseus]MBJ6362116.1 hypothetical protein [Paenibacillus roseus]
MSLHFLAEAPSITERLNAALEDDFYFHKAFYNRKEGATTALVNLAKNNDSIALVAKLPDKWRCLFPDVDWHHADSIDFGMKPNVKTVIADCVEGRELHRLYERARAMRIKLIAITAIN